MNTTTDKEGRILHYEEEAYMKIETDELNSYTKIKTTNLFVNRFLKCLYFLFFLQ